MNNKTLLVVRLAAAMPLAYADQGGLINSRRFHFGSLQHHQCLGRESSGER